MIFLSDENINTDYRYLHYSSGMEKKNKTWWEKSKKSFSHVSKSNGKWIFILDSICDDK